ncbi:radical SAM protein [Rhizobium sp. ZPR3]|uniref:Radical SAM protein n=2 Tax=unclassified Rhizobium TaxID=2613769 RepID=A0AAU7SS15_9HYPH
MEFAEENLSNEAATALDMATNGCMVLRHRTMRLQVLLESGVSGGKSPQFNNLSIISGCAVIKATEDESIELIKERLKAGGASHRVIITGCLPKINSARLYQEFDDRVQIVTELEDVPKFLGIKVPLGMTLQSVAVPDHLFDHSHGDPLMDKGDPESELERGFERLAGMVSDPWIEEFYRYQTKGRHFWREPRLREVLVTEGCDYKCSFCATKFAIGNTRSRPFEQIISEIRTAHSEGVEKIVLQGDEVGNYRSSGKTLEDVVYAFRSLRTGTSRSRLALRYIHPSPLIRFGKWLEESFESGDAYFVCCALQTGNQQIGKAMRRSFSIKAAADRLANLRSKNPRAYIHTQLIAGYPGETDAQFEDTLALVRDYEFDYISYAQFDARPGTVAAALDCQIPQDVAKERFDRLAYAVENVRIKRLKQHARAALLRSGSDWTQGMDLDPLHIVRLMGSAHPTDAAQQQF